MLEGCTPWPQDAAERYLREGYWERQTIGDCLERAATIFGEKTAVTDASRRLTYAELNARVDQLALRFLDIGLKPKDIVLLQLPNIVEFFYVFFAAQKIGLIPVMCLPPHRQAEIGYFAELTRAKAYFIPDEFRGFDYIAMAGEIRARVSSIEHVFVAGKKGGAARTISLDALIEEPVGNLEGESGERALKRCRPDPFEVALFLLSGGTTGIPKLIPRTHTDYIYNAKCCAAVARFDGDTVFLAAIPAAHNFPLGCPGLLGAIIAGGRTVLCSTDAQQIIDSIERERVTATALSPALLINILDSPRLGRADLGSLRCLMVGGQRLLPEAARRTLAVFKMAALHQVFGMAEGLINMTRADDPEEVITDTQGRPVSPADEIKLVDDDDNGVPQGEVGELLARGPYTIRGYYKAPDHNEKAFTKDGFYRTGDMVRVHRSGNLVVEGRRKDMINRGGEKISAEEVENLILSHPKVLNAAVVAMPDPLLGERACAYLILKPGESLSFDQLIDFLRSKQIAKFKLPERLEIVEKFPLTGVGKVSKKDLREDIRKKLEAEGKIRSQSAG